MAYQRNRTMKVEKGHHVILKVSWGLFVIPFAPISAKKRAEILCPPFFKKCLALGNFLQKEYS